MADGEEILREASTIPDIRSIVLVLKIADMIVR